ncbi:MULTISPECIES: hypothetical protein [Frankia]|uniref:Uncharacterized protein n=1 Tax=Frankia alni (strain DSM 45986 / CECT 9034 / ACN14a) TaxID=326424 RepID=Q0RU36_FRAAA|nr:MULTISPECIES: hypothetical protein [Frankia]CAJ58908.1 hypothetical protein FRAAL0230 [Frankia alni ACN14a]
MTQPAEPTGPGRGARGWRRGPAGRGDGLRPGRGGDRARERRRVGAAGFGGAADRGGPAAGGRRTGRREENEAETGSRIGLWGATQSGKTTMLAALQVAVARQRGGEQDWLMFPGNARTSRFLAEAGTQLANGEFPQASTDVPEPLSLRMLRPRSRGAWLARMLRQRARRRDFRITLLDVSGTMFRNQPEEAVLGPSSDDYVSDLFAQTPEAGDDVENLVDHLARADGMVYLFDPLREAGRGDSYQFLESMLGRVALRAEELSRLPDGKLPHYLAICVTKIDDPEVFRQAYDGGFVGISEDETLQPEIVDDDAADFFAELCRGGRAGSGVLVRGMLERYFHPDRIRYFATSSVGFYIGPSGYFRIQDFRNVEDGVGGVNRIRGRARPVNVLEPFLWLEDSIRRARPPRAVEPTRPREPGDDLDDLDDLGGPDGPDNPDGLGPPTGTGGDWPRPAGGAGDGTFNPPPPPGPLVL